MTAKQAVRQLVESQRGELTALSRRIHEHQLVLDAQRSRNDICWSVFDC
jgi:hypothetical protein